MKIEDLQLRQFDPHQGNLFVVEMPENTDKSLMDNTVDILSNLKDKQGMKDLNFLLLVRFFFV